MFTVNFVIIVKKKKLILKLINKIGSTLLTVVKEKLILWLDVSPDDPGMIF